MEKESNFKVWLEQGGALTASGRNSRTYAVRAIEQNLSPLGMPYKDLEEAWEADRLIGLRERLKKMREDARNGGQDYRILMPESEKPHNRLSNWGSWLGQYGRFLAGDPPGAAKDADRIRQYVIEHYIEPAREEGHTQIDVLVRDVNGALGLKEAWPNICQALAGRIFQDLSQLPVPERIGADQSSATVFRFDIRDQSDSRNGRPFVLFDAEGSPYQPVKNHNRTSGISAFYIKPKGAKNSADDAIKTEDIQEVARAVLIEGLAARIKAISGGPVNYLTYGGNKLVRYELDPEIAKAIGIPVRGGSDGVPLQTDSDGMEDKTKMDPVTTNLILYGPPGTGKTFTTAAEAVRLCGEPVSDDRTELMATYQRLMNEGRIEFVTFHQSLSYEEFVEGLRPSTGSDNLEEDGGADAGAGFDLKCHEGIFKRFSERARLDESLVRGSPHLDRKQGLFKLSLIGSDWREQLATATQSKRISWGFGADIDWSAPEFEDFQAIKKLWLEENPDVDGRSADISGTWYFRGAVDLGSYVVLTVGKNRIVALGRIAGDYEYHPDAAERQHSRLVDWIWTNEQGDDRSSFYPQKFSAFQPMYQLAADKIDWDALESIILEGGPQHGSSILQSSNETSPDGKAEMPQEQASSNTNYQPNSLVDLAEIELSAQPEGDLYTVGALPEVRSGTFRHLAQDVAVQLANKHPYGFALNQYREALIQSGKIVGVEPTGGWENHNMPSWASHPNQAWLVSASKAISKFAAPNQVSTKCMGFDDRQITTGDSDANQYVLIIDEINRANISKVFGELITLLEQDKRLGAQNEVRVQLPYSKKRFGVPTNLHIIGTMNTADRSIALLDTALRRRFTFREMMPDPSVLNDAIEKCGINLPRLLTTINERIEYLYDREHQIGHAYFTGCNSLADVDQVMRHKVIPLLAEYFFEDWDKIAAVLGDLKPHESAISGNFLNRSVLKAPPGLEDGDALPRFRWKLRSESEGFDYAMLLGE